MPKGQWYCKNCGDVSTRRTTDETCAVCGNKIIWQEVPDEAGELRAELVEAYSRLHNCYCVGPQPGHKYCFCEEQYRNKT